MSRRNLICKRCTSLGVCLNAREIFITLAIFFLAILTTMANASDKLPPVGFDALTAFDSLPLLTDWPAYQDSSFSRKNINQDAGNFIRVEKNGEQVLTDTDGPGVIYRIWSTGVVGRQMSKDCRLRFYLDHEKKPRLDLAMSELFGDRGSRWPFVPPLSETFESGRGPWEGPCNLCYVPIPFSKHIKITGKNVSFYHVDYHKLPLGTAVESFSYEYAEKHRTSWEKEASDLRHVGRRPGSLQGERTRTLKDFMIQKGMKETIRFQGQGMITTISVLLDKPTEEILRGVVLEIAFDGKKHVCVRVPVGDFFGAGCGDRRFKSLPCGMTDEGYYAYWPMPFRKDVAVTLRNETNTPVRILKMHIGWIPYVLSENAGYFHARYVQDPDIPLHKDYRILEVDGRGKLVGANVTMQNTRDGQGIFFLEGDEKIYVDGEKYPSRWLGTGTEDYFNGAYFWNAENKAAMARPFGGLTFLDWGIGRVCAYRWHITDFISFDKHIILDLEHGGVSDVPCNYQSVAYYYLDKPVAQPPLPLLEERLPKTHLSPAPRYMCCDLADMPALNDMPLKKITFQELNPRFDSRDSLILGLGEAGDTVKIPLNIPGEDNFKIDLYLSCGPRGGKINVLLDGVAIGNVFTFSRDYRPWLMTEFGPVRLSRGKHVLNLYLEKAGTGGGGSFAVGLVAVQMKPQSRFIDKWSVIGNWPCPKKDGWKMVPEVEKHQDLKSEYTLPGGQKVSWLKYVGEHVGLRGGDWLVAYGLTYVHSPDNRTVACFITKDDGMKIWLNNEVAYDQYTWSHAINDQFYCTFKLKKGWNKVLVKCANWFGGWGFALRLSDPDSQLRYSRSKD